MKYKNKKVLLIGGGYELKWIVPYLKQEGAFLYYINKNASKGKNKDLVDEFADIDFRDLDKALDYCLKNKIDGVISDSSETNIEICRELNEKLGNPFYYTKEQWNTFCVKDNFSKLCESYGIRTPKTYFNGGEKEFKSFNKLKLKYPVVSKPVDSCGGRGCYKCNNFLELILLARHSFLNSSCKRIIVEECLNGQEATLSFAIKDHECRLIASTDRYVRYKKQFKYNVHSYFLSPSKFSNSFMENQFESFSKMFVDQGLNNCAIFVQGFFNKEKFIPLEAGLRFEGTYTFLNNVQFNKQDFRHLVIDNILKVNTDYDIEKDNYKYNGKICFYNGIYLKPGQIATIKGVEDISSIKNCYGTFIYKKVGDVVTMNTVIKRVFGCFNFSCSSIEEARDFAKTISKTLKIEDKNGRNLIIKSRKLF